MAKPVIGILTWREGHSFKEPGYFRSLVKEGQKLGATVFIFSHKDAFPDKKQVRGYVPSEKGGWTHRTFPWPDVVIDRCRTAQDGYREFRKQKHFIYANNTFTNKMSATRLFTNNESLIKWIPATVDYSLDNLTRMFKKHTILYIKPGNGTGGKSIVKVSKTKDGYRLLGRTRGYGRRNLLFKDISSLGSWLNRWVQQERIRKGSFMIQQGLDLELIPGHVSDMRLLIQKNDSGNWEVTGEGMRIGGVNNPTSNLHGGGRAASVADVLHKRFGVKKTEEIVAECRELAHGIVSAIEKQYGSMLEFGLDIGIDTRGRVWLIEVNPKPGRELFKKMGRSDLYAKAIRRPIQYAMHLKEESEKE
ncbi:YheC/YheD family protein [Paenibacillus sp. FJAT-26967]|uniref:YheC/YheD family endospore coat-associated protein n=1 Tax=Paenibacillus sp. FJAT-26967 TaxID=1729690 RepID=UPI0008388FDA|nr:YheC/YheD family protein [Paenibacillus sp. FJAT-26967]